MGLGRLNAIGSSNPGAFAYGPLIKDPNGIFDLPKGFSYRVISVKGRPMSDGLLVPGDPDGMAAFALPEGRVALVCNHELKATEVENSPFGANSELLSKIPAEDLYDYADGYYQKDHGYNFEVPVTEQPQRVRPVPLKAMGRFNHEAIAVEPKSGIVYQTEDRWDGLIYRFIPNTSGKLHEGGRLQALAIKEHPSWDTRNWSEPGTKPFPARQSFETYWIDIENVESPEDDLRYQGSEKGAAVFARGEGMWYGDGEVYFACTNGGPIRMGQVFRYMPSPYEGTPRESEKPGTVELFVESKDKDVLKNCDNLTVAPWGDLFIAEDSDMPCKLVGVTPEGTCFDFAANPYNESELAGCCFSPDGKILFVNIQGPGLTLAISGPWGTRG